MPQCCPRWCCPGRGHSRAAAAQAPRAAPTGGGHRAPLPPCCVPSPTLAPHPASRAPDPPCTATVLGRASARLCLHHLFKAAAPARPLLPLPVLQARPPRQRSPPYLREQEHLAARRQQRWLCPSTKQSCGFPSRACSCLPAGSRPAACCPNTGRAGSGPRRGHPGIPSSKQHPSHSPRSCTQPCLLQPLRSRPEHAV